MQESLLSTVKKLQSEEKINVEELEIVLDSDIEEVVKLCKKACLKPKTDSMGNAYFTTEDVSVLRKMKELFNQTQTIQNETTVKQIAPEEIQTSKENLDKKINFLAKAKDRIKSQNAVQSLATSAGSALLQNSLAGFEKNIINKMSELLSEKMDGFDEIIVELIRAKTENENLRQQVNSLNKQVFILKNELASFNPIAFGLYTRIEKKDI